MSDPKNPPLPRKTRRKALPSQAALSASQILEHEINDLVELMARVKELSLDHQEPGDLLGILEGIGRSCSRLVTMLKAANALGEGDEVGKAVHEAVQYVLGKKPLFQSLRAGGPGGEASGTQFLDPGRQPAGNSLEQPLDGASSAAATPAKTGARPTRKPAAGQKPKKRSHETAE